MQNTNQDITIAVHIPKDSLKRVFLFMKEFDCSWDTLVTEALEKYIDSFPSEEE